MNNKQFKNELKVYVDKALKDFRLHFGDATPSVCSEHLTVNNYVTLIGLKNLALDHKELSDKQIEDLIKGKQTMPFLNKFITTIPNAIKELKFRGAYSVALTYTNLMYRRDYYKGATR